MIPIENWARVRGRIEAVEQADVGDHLAVHIEVSAVESVEGYPNRLHREPGDDLTVLVRRSSIGEVTPGGTLEARVRRAGLDQVYAHPEDLSVDPA
jgi:hypothetical protein